MKTRYKDVTVNPDRHGKLRARYRPKNGKGGYMKTLPDQPGFEAEYKALQQNTGQDLTPRFVTGTVHDLCSRYYQSADFAARGGDDDKRRRRGLIESFREEFGNDLVTDFTAAHIEAILIARTAKRKNEKKRIVGGEVAAFNLRKQLFRLFRYAKDKLEWISKNPVEVADKVGKKKLTGYHTWSEQEIAQYQAAHPYGTKARLALETLLWTGKRRSDARLFGPKHIIDGKITFVIGKTGKPLSLPVANDLRRAIAAMPKVGMQTYLVTEYGRTYSKDGFGNAMREWCDLAGLPQCSAHGLRKAITRRMAQLGLSDEQMMAVTGHKNAQELRAYTEAVEQEELAEGAIARVDNAYSTKTD